MVLILFLFFSSPIVYLKFLLLWVFILSIDYVTEFRFEFLWPFWLLIRSVYDSFKYQGLVSYNILIIIDCMKISLANNLFCLYRLFQYCLFVSPLLPTWCVFSSSLFNGCYFWPVLTSGCNTSGTQTEVSVCLLLFSVLSLFTLRRQCECAKSNRLLPFT